MATGVGIGRTNIPLREIHTIGKGVTERLVNRVTCPALPAFGIVLTGITEAAPGGDFYFTRLCPRIGQLLVGLSGEGRVWVNDRWEPCGPGQAYITPPG